MSRGNPPALRRAFGGEYDHDGRGVAQVEDPRKSVRDGLTLERADSLELCLIGVWYSVPFEVVWMASARSSMPSRLLTQSTMSDVFSLPTAREGS